MKKIAIFGTSWSDPRYAERPNVDMRHKVWNEFIVDYVNCEIDVFAVSGSSLEYQMALFQSVILTRKKYDVVIFEIPPLGREWISCDTTLDFTPNDGMLNENFWVYDGFNNEIIGGEYDVLPPKLPQGYRHWARYDMSEYHMAGGAYVISDGKSPISGHNTTMINNFLKERSIYAQHQVLMKNLLFLDALSNNYKKVTQNLVTISFADIKSPLIKKLRNELYPSNISMNDLLNISKINLGENYDGSEWWVDDAHLSEKGQRWLFENIMLNNDKFKDMLDSL